MTRLQFLIVADMLHQHLYGAPLPDNRVVPLGNSCRNIACELFCRGPEEVLPISPSRLNEFRIHVKNQQTGDWGFSDCP